MITIKQFKYSLIHLRKRITSFIVYHSIKSGIRKSVRKINLCGIRLSDDNFFNIDLNPKSDLVIDLEKRLLPFKDNTAEVVVCISAVNYFTRERGAEIIKDVYRVLKLGGIARFGTQDLFEISKKYVNMDKDFFYQKLQNGKDRFHGKTMADKINSWFYGYKTNRGKYGKYFYDFETLALLFKEAGFSKIEKKNFMESLIPEIKQIDNRSDQMFFLEAVK